MSGLLRLIVLAVGFWLSLRFFQSLQPESRPSNYQDPLGPDSEFSIDKGDTWSPEERAEWRDSVDQRLHR